MTGVAGPGAAENRPSDQYFSDRPAVASDPRRVEVLLPDVSFTMTTDTGVFSHGHLDPGTSLLLRTVPTPADHAVVLDLGCGAGPIALTLALRVPSACVWAVDVNERARDLCAANAAALDLGTVEVAAPDEVPADVRFDTIWSNPPIRIGKEGLHRMLDDWLRRLVPTGDAWLVVHKHLGADSLQRWLEQSGHRTERIASRSGFRILHVLPRSAVA